MENNENEIKFDQLMMKINIGEYPFITYPGKIIFLNKGILIIHNNEIFFYDFIKYSRHFIMTITKEFGDNNYTGLGRLKNNKFYMYTENETLIYQFNDDDFTIKLLKRINISLFHLREIDDNVYIHTKDEYMYIWKELKPIFKKNQLIFYIMNTIFVLFLYLLLFNFNKILVYTIIILEYTTFIFVHPKFVYLFNPYKRIKTCMNTHIAKCGKYLCFETKSRNKALIDYKNFTIKNIKLDDEQQNTLYPIIFPINDNIVIFSNILDKKYKVYDVQQDKISKDYTNDFSICFYQASKVEDNLYYIFADDYVYKWKFNFELNKVDILSKKIFKNLGKFSECKIINDKLYIVDKKLNYNILPLPPSNICIYIYQ